MGWIWDAAIGSPALSCINGLITNGKIFKTTLILQCFGLAKKSSRKNIKLKNLGGLDDFHEGTGQRGSNKGVHFPPHRTTYVVSCWTTTRKQRR